MTLFCLGVHFSLKSPWAADIVNRWTSCPRRRVKKTCTENSKYYFCKIFTCVRTDDAGQKIQIWDFYTRCFILWLNCIPFPVILPELFLQIPPKMCKYLKWRRLELKFLKRKKCIFGQWVTKPPKGSSDYYTPRYPKWSKFWPTLLDCWVTWGDHRDC